jgi:glutamine cyclotransferase
MSPTKLSVLIAIPLLIFSCKNSQSVATQADAQQQTQVTAPARVPTYTYEIVRGYPHDPGAFTQGLVYHQGVFYESTGLNGQSSLRKVEIETGRVLQKIDVPAQFFAEGLALFNGRLHQLTWQNRRGFIYDLNSFNLLNSFEYTGEGWGLAHDGTSLILSDGTDQIRYLDAGDFHVRATIRVHDNGRQITLLNELEYIKGEIYANVWQTDRIARIDPKTGRVTAWINLSGLLSPEDRAGRSVDVLNGIAYDEAADRLFVTGKYWPKLFEIKLKLPRNQIRR